MKGIPCHMLVPVIEDLGSSQKPEVERLNALEKTTLTRDLAASQVARRYFAQKFHPLSRYFVAGFLESLVFRSPVD